MHSTVREWVAAREDNVEEFNKIRNSSQYETSLSPNVLKHLLFHNDDENVLLLSDDELIHKETGLLKWESLSTIIVDDDKDDDTIAFNMAIPKVKRIALQIHNYLQSSNLNNQQFMNRYHSSFILAEPKVMEWSYEAHRNNHSLFAFTLIVPYLERALQDALYNYLLSRQQQQQDQPDKKKTNEQIESQIPTKLNSLFLVKEMKQIFGEDIIFLLRLLIGPLNGMNLRNVTIHGFISPDEFHPSLTSFLLVLIASLSDYIQNRFHEGYTIRPLRILSERFGFKAECILVFDEIDGIQREWEQLIDHSLFVIPTFKSQWRLAIELYSKQLYYQSLVVLFPLIEHSIRRIYVCSNSLINSSDNDDESVVVVALPLLINRLLTADSNVLYTTLDILLNVKLQQQQVDEPEVMKWNRIFEELGCHLSNLIFDILIWNESEDLDLKSTYECPRIRDHVSHGNIDPSSLSPIIADRVMVMTLGLLAHFDIRRGAKQENTIVEWPSIVTKSYHYIHKEYEPLFHPKSLLLNEIKSFSEQWIQHRNVVNRVQPSDGGDTSSIQQLESHLQSIIDPFHSMNNIKYKFRSGTEEEKGENELVIVFRVDCTEKELTRILICRKIANHVIEFHREFIQYYTDLQNKVETHKAWKRDRKAFDLLQQYSHSFLLLLEFFMLLIQNELFNKNNNNNNNSEEEVPVDTDLVHRLWKLSGTITSSLKAGRLQRVFEVIHAFFIGNMNYKTLSKKESINYLTSMDGYFVQV